MAFKQFLLIALLACGSTVPAVDQLRDEPIRPLPIKLNLNLQKVALGEQLFHDVRLSADNSISCASCHPLAQGGADHLQKSIGIGGGRGIIKAPTVYNSGLNFVQFWDGRAATLEQQIDGPVNSPREMGSSWAAVTKRLSADAEMRRAFDDLYDGGISQATIKNAIAEFERSLVTANSRFDRWLRGDDAALTGMELQGYYLFKSYGCVSCHQGANVGGNMYGYMGALGDYFSERGGAITAADLGRFNVTGKEGDRHYFKVPSLRLASRNPPYFHDGSAATLEEAVRVMGLYQLGRKIPGSDLQQIIAFLDSLVGNSSMLQPR